VSEREYTRASRHGWIINALSPFARRFLNGEFGHVVIQFGKFGPAGVRVRAFALDPNLSRLISDLRAATTTWALNRVFTFRHSARDGIPRQWATFLVARPWAAW